MFAGLKAAGRVKLVDGDNQEILPGIRVYTGGKHTFASQYVGVTTASGTVVIASDNAYLYKNLDEKRAIAQTLDAASNLAAQARMIEIAGSPARVIPGHDPDVFSQISRRSPRASCASLALDDSVRAAPPRRTTSTESASRAHR